MVPVETFVVVASIATVAVCALIYLVLSRRGPRPDDRVRANRADREAPSEVNSTELPGPHAELLQSEKLASMGLVAAGIAHDINNPAAYLLANLELLHDSLLTLRNQRDTFAAAAPAGLGVLPTEAEVQAVDRLADDALQDALDGVHRIRDIVSDLTALASEDIQPEEPVWLSSVAETSAELARPVVGDRASLELSLQAVPQVVGRAGELSQVVVQLIMNAAEAMWDDDSRPRRIKVHTLVVPQGVALEVTDTGRGIHPSALAEIFRPRYTTKASGVGLGLSVCRRIVDGHGGRIEVESVLGEGSTFRIVLPVPAATDRVGVVAMAPAIHAGVETESVGPDAGAGGDRTPPRRAARPAAVRVGARKRVMIVDDEALLLRVLARFVGRHHEVSTAVSADEAVVRIRDGFVPDLVFCDLSMPTKTGADLYGTLLADFPEIASRVTFMSGGAIDKVLNAFPSRVGRPALVKPLEPDALLGYIDAQPAAAQPTPSK